MIADPSILVQGLRALLCRWLAAQPLDQRINYVARRTLAEGSTGDRALGTLSKLARETFFILAERFLCRRLLEICHPRCVCPFAATQIIAEI